MADITPGQIKIINTIISVRNLKEYKEDMVRAFSDGRVSSTTGLTYAEADALIKHLNADKTADFEKGHKMRGLILSMAHELHWHIPGTNKIDFKVLNNWCVKFGYLKKKIDAYTYAELPKLVTQFRNMHADFIKKL
jgi:hypothetical protein